MRKIESEMYRAVYRGTDWKKGNTEVRVDPHGSIGVYLHGNRIAYTTLNHGLTVDKDTLRRWPSVTTMSRLRALGFNVCRRDYRPMLDGKEV